jgi:hypothetical protein
VAYWVVVGLLLVFGLLTGFTIGLPFFFLGVVLAVVAPYRHRRSIFWPPILAVVAFVAGFILVAPLGCTATAVAPGQGATGHTVCTNVVGIDYSGQGIYNPSLLPALLVGLATAAAVATLARVLFRRHEAKAA